ncbi:MAG: carboxy terminal-processing peptidase, partial [Lutibacter sp.]|nr:carboxy terminal-processing peptidase [Lutibacter sp.]
MTSYKRRFIYTLLFLCCFFLSLGSKAAENNPREKLLLTILRYVLTEGHYQPQELDDAFSERVFEEFLGRLDPSKRYFLQSDIDAFSVYSKAIDDQIKQEDLSFFFTVFDRYIERTREGKLYYQEILATTFDFNKEEALELDPEKKTYAIDKSALYEKWRRQLKFSTLSRVYDKVLEEKKKAEEDSTYTAKTFDLLENKAREATLKSMNDTYDRFEELTYADWFSSYVNCISEDFDPHTSYFDPNLKKRFDISMAGKLEGIGARLQKKNDYTKVSELISGGPAWQQGELEVEDIILKVAQGDEEPIDIVGMRLDDAIEYIKGKKGTEVRLTVKKIDGSLKVISIIRDVVQLEDTFVKSSIVRKNNRSFGLINLPKFYIDFSEKTFRNSATDMAQEIRRLKEENIEGLIIDLRNNGGGSLKTAIEISGLFIDKGPIVQVKYRGQRAKIKGDKDVGVLWNGPLVLLVNEFSASASEIFAAAMQDYGRAVIVGAKKTFGKGTVQNVLDLNRYSNIEGDMGALKLTIQKFYRVNGGSTQLAGVSPDIVLPSRYDYMKIGESDLSNPLPFDKVPQANYTPSDHYKNAGVVVSNSQQRVAQSGQFKLIDSQAKWLKKSQDDTVVNLNYNSF